MIQEDAVYPSEIDQKLGNGTEEMGNFGAEVAEFASVAFSDEERAAIFVNGGPTVGHIYALVCTEVVDSEDGTSMHWAKFQLLAMGEVRQQGAVVTPPAGKILVPKR